jgi:hypothetical protein
LNRREALAALGLSEGFSAAEAKSAFRQAVFWCHPDRNPGNKAAEEAFKRINAAYELVSDEGSPRGEPGNPWRPRQGQERGAVPAAAPAAGPSSKPRGTWPWGKLIAGILYLGLALGGLYALTRKPRATDGGSGAQAVSVVGTSSDTAPITARFLSRCPLTAQEITDQLLHSCIVLELANQSERDVALDFGVRIDLSRQDGELVPLRASPTGPPATFELRGAHFGPNQSLQWIVRGVTTERVVGKRVIVTPVAPR